VKGRKRKGQKGRKWGIEGNKEWKEEKARKNAENRDF